jgi:enoyl-CoA hydratase/carnithine racemase
MTDQIKITEHNGVLTLQLNRPDLRNAISDEMIESIVETCDRINRDMSIGCMVITGAGDGFCSGGDLKDMVTRTGHFAGPPIHARRVYLHGIQQIPLALYNCQVPTIAAVNGSAVGAGCDLALMCDLRIASEKASFAESFLRVGLISGDGGAWFLPRRVGLAKACRMTFTGEFVKPDKALEWGLVEEVVPHEQLMERAHALAAQIASQPPHALRMTKQLLRRSLDMTLPDSLELAAAMQAISLETSDHREAFMAFKEKRTPSFTGT